jgi:DNA repair photolyase
LAPLFRAWLAEHYPLRAEHVMSLVQDIRGGRDYDSEFGVRMRGAGEYARLIEQRFVVACRRLGLNHPRDPAGRTHGPMDTSRFRPPARTDGSERQLDLFA